MEDIIVTGRRYVSSHYIFPGIDPAPHNPNPELDPNDPNEPMEYEEHTDRSDLETYLIDVSPLTNTSNFYIDIGNHVIKITIDNNFFASGSWQRAKIAEALGVLLRAYYSADLETKNRIEALENLVFCNVEYIKSGVDSYPGRSASEENVGTFYYDIDEINVSAGFLASNIYHDASHIYLYNQYGDVSFSRGVQVEKNLIGDVLARSSIFELSPYEVVYLNNYRNNDQEIENRANARPMP